MKKSFAWTLAEMVIAITVIVILTGACLNVFKPKTQNSKLYVFATVRNLMRANSVLLQDNKKNLEEYTNYCNALADIFTLAGNTCGSGGSTNGVLTFVNGSTVEIISTAWQDDTGNDRKFLNIVIDVDGSKGVNKVWVDRFPMRIYSAPGYDGVIFPINCSTLSGSGAPCYGDTTNYLTDNTVVSYDIFRAENFIDSGDMTSSTKLVAATLSPKEADCTAYGGRGFFKVSECSGFALNQSCATEETCDTGLSNKNTCLGWRTSNNPDDLPCYTLLHKPNAGMSFIVESVVGEIDTDY